MVCRMELYLTVSSQTRFLVAMFALPFEAPRVAHVHSHGSYSVLLFEGVEQFDVENISF